MYRLSWFYVLSILFCTVMVTENTVAGENLKKSIVKIYTVKTRPIHYNPWDMDSPKMITGSGCVIKGNRILTNAHVVSDQTFIQASRYGEAKKYKAKVLAVSHEADLALLTVEDKEFFKGIKPLSLGGLPDIQEKVVVYGFPQGGDTLSFTSGVISRIEHQRYSHSSIEFLAIQIDAAINPGNSGGPAITNGKVIGVVMQSRKNAENIGYIVPVPIVKHFLTDLKDGKHDGVPEDGLMVQSMENKGMKKMYGLTGDETGVLVVAVIPGSPTDGMVKPKDVVLSIDGHKIADDGTVEFRSGERTSGTYYTQLHQMGEKQVLEIKRKGKKMKVEITLTKTAHKLHLVPTYSYDTLPAYYICGGLVFSPLSLDYLREWGGAWRRNAPINLLHLLYNTYPSVKGEEVVNMIDVLPHDVNNGYHNLPNCVITEVNGTKVNNLKELIAVVEAGKEKPFIEFKTMLDKYIVLDRAEAEKTHNEILGIYGVPADRSVDLR